VGWSFAIPDSNPVLQSLAMGQILNLIYTITLNNGPSQDVTVTLIGTNDIPSIVSSSIDTPVLTEDSVAANLNISVGGTIMFQFDRHPPCDGCAEIVHLERTSARVYR
jgi:hypothetical protein